MYRTYEISFIAKAQSARTVGLALRGEQTNTDVWSTSASLTTTAQTFGPYQFYCTNSAVNSNATFSLAFYLAYGTISDVWIDNVVVKDITTGFVTANAVTVSPARLSLTTGQTGQLTKTVAPANATNNTVTWTSSNTSIATVSSTGMVTAVSTGNATITATSADGGFTAQSVVSVNVGVTSYSTRLSGTVNERYGLAKSLSVMPGDTIQMEVYAKYLDNNANNWNAALTNLMTSIAQGTAPTGTFVDGGAAGSIGGTTFPFVGTLPRTGDTGTGPKAYLNYIVFDKNFVYKTGGFKRLSAAPIENGSDVPHERLAFDGAERIIITEPGFVYIYLSNENDTPLEVYFDDFKVDHIKGPIVSSQDYYPFGLTFNSYQRENSVQQPYQYNGKEIQDELNLGWMDYGARMYDSKIGRWYVVDPLADLFASWSPYTYAYNNPIRFTDPLGMANEDEVKKEPDPPTTLDPGTEPPREDGMATLMQSNTSSKDNSTGSSTTVSGCICPGGSGDIPAPSGRTTSSSKQDQKKAEQNESNIYAEISNSFNETKKDYMVAEGVGPNALFNMIGFYSVRRIKGHYYFNASAAGTTPAESQGDPKFQGNAILIVNGKMVSKTPFVYGDGYNVKFADGFSNLGALTLKLPSSGNVMIKLEFSYHIVFGSAGRNHSAIMVVPVYMRTIGLPRN